MCLNGPHTASPELLRSWRFQTEPMFTCVLTFRDLIHGQFAPRVGDLVTLHDDGFLLPDVVLWTFNSPECPVGRNPPR